MDKHDMSTTKWSIAHEKENGNLPFWIVGIGVRCQWIVAVEQTIRMKIQLDYEMFIPERYGTFTISVLFILLYITEYFSF